jgi:hypothetical protein
MIYQLETAVDKLMGRQGSSNTVLMIDQLETAADKLMGRQVASNTYD